MAFHGFLKQSTAVTIVLGPIVDSTDGDSEETTVIADTDIYLSKNGGAFAAKNDTGDSAHLNDGCHDCDLNATDTNTVGMLTVETHTTGTLLVKQDYMVLVANVYDAMFGSTADLGTDVAAILTDTAEIGTAAGADIAADIAAVKSDTGAAATAAALTTVDNEIAAMQGDVTSILADTAEIGTPAGADIAADIAAVKADTGAGATAAALTTVDNEIAAIQGDVTNILADTAEIGTPAGTDIAADIAAVKADTGAAATAAALTTVDNEIAAIQGDVTNILADTAEIGTAAGVDIAADIAAVKADTGAAATAAALTTVDNEIAAMQGNVTNILADTAEIGTPAGADIAADIAAVKAETALIVEDTADMQPRVVAIEVDTGTTLDGRIPAALVGGRMNSNMDAIDGDADAATNLSASASVIVIGTVEDSGFAPTTIEFEASDITEATADHYNGRRIIFVTGDLAEQGATISDYSLVGGSGHFTVPAMTEAPADGDTFVIV